MVHKLLLEKSKSCNAKESEKKFMDPSPDVDLQYTKMCWFLLMYIASLHQMLL